MSISWLELAVWAVIQSKGGHGSSITILFGSCHAKRIWEGEERQQWNHMHIKKLEMGLIAQTEIKIEL